MGGITHAPNVQVQTGRLAWNKQIIAQFRAALVIAPIADPNDAMPFGFLFRWSEEMQVGGLMPDEGPTVPSRLAIYLRQCCTEGQDAIIARQRSEEHTSELQSLMRISYAVFCLKKKKKHDSDHDQPRYTEHRNTING